MPRRSCASSFSSFSAPFHQERQIIQLSRWSQKPGPLQFVNVPDMTLSFTQGGTSSGCVLVRYSAEVLSSPGTSGDNDQMIVRPLLDGSVQSVPPQSDLTSDDDEDHDRRFLRAHSFEFLFASVSPGPHTIVMQWRGTQSSVMNKRSRVTTVLPR
jgi:hypothetical protein